MVTFSDMCTLLLTFFVLLFSMSSISSERFQEFFRSFSGDELGLMMEGDMVHSSDFVFDPLPEVAKNPTRAALVDLSSSVEEGLGSGSVADAVEFYVEDSPDGAISIVLAEKVLFREGSAELTAESGEFLELLRNFLARVLEVSDRRVIIEGHTDNSLPPRDAYILSARRAVAVLDFLLSETEERGAWLPPERFMVAGYGSTRPKVPNDTPENQAANRRVRVFLEPPDASIFSNVIQ